MSDLRDLLDPAAVALSVEVENWREAVTRCGDLLVHGGVTTADYTRDMLNALDRLGPYIVIAPGFALAHAQASESVIRTGLSWLSLKTPVSFGHGSNDPVSLVVGLASHDHDAHIKALQQIAVVLMTPGRLEELAKVEDPMILISQLAK